MWRHITSLTTNPFGTWGDEMSDKANKSPPGLIPPHGGYRELKSYQNAEIVYDATVAFCDRFVDRRSRTHDQMV
jgi:hypothetical protein